MKTKVLALSSVLLFITVFTNAQKVYKEGYIITTEFDTIRGLLVNGDYRQNSQFIEFVKEDSSDEIKYFPGQIFGYRFTDGKYYISHEVEVDSINRTVFLEYLIKGELNLYYYRDDLKKDHYFAEKAGSPFKELYYGERIEKDEFGNEFFVEDNRYKGFLALYTSDYPDLYSRIDNMSKISKKGLIGLAKDYHENTCMGEKCIVFEKQIPNKIKISAVSGGRVYLEDDGQFEFFQEISPVSVTARMEPLYGIHAYFQQAGLSEYLYLGVGIESGRKSMTFSQYPLLTERLCLPLSLNYFSPNEGFSWLFTFELDLASKMLIQGLKTGVSYGSGNFNVDARAGVYTMLFFFPYSFSIDLGVSYTIR